jgi:signal transduction histidine kinase
VVLADHIKKSLNSIKILLRIAVKETENKNATNYFELIEKTRVQLFSRVEDSLKKLYGEDIISLKHIDFDEMISKIQLSLTNMDGFDEIKFKIRVKNNNTFYSDSDAIRSIIQNLMENAIKYRKHDNQRHSVGLSVEDNTDGIIMIIADNGIGIKKELISKIFAFGVRDKNSLEEGHGIGLSLVKQLLDQLGGQISVNSVINQGTLFTIKIPNATKSFHHI